MASRKATRVTYLDPRRILPLHEIKRWKHFRELVARMRKNGWEGRPLLVETMHGGRHYAAWTGTHRLAAAKAAGLTRVPVEFVRGGKPATRLALVAQTTTDPSRYMVLRSRRDMKAAAAMRDEINTNARANAAGVL